MIQKWKRIVLVISGIGLALWIALFITDTHPAPTTTVVNAYNNLHKINEYTFWTISVGFYLVFIATRSLKSRSIIYGVFGLINAKLVLLIVNEYFGQISHNLILKKFSENPYGYESLAIMYVAVLLALFLVPTIELIFKLITLVVNKIRTKSTKKSLTKIITIAIFPQAFSLAITTLNLLIIANIVKAYSKEYLINDIDISTIKDYSPEKVIIAESLFPVFECIHNEKNDFVSTFLQYTFGKSTLMNEKKLNYYLGKDCLVVILPTNADDANLRLTAKAGEILLRSKYGKYIKAPENYHPQKKLSLQENSNLLNELRASGAYSRISGKIVVDKTDINILEVIIHEELHAFSANYTKDTLHNYTEFEEGLTQYLTVKLFEDSGISTYENLRYKEYFWAVSSIAEKLGDNLLIEGYFSGDLELIANQIDKATKPNFFCGFLLSLKGYFWKTPAISQEDAYNRINALSNIDLETIPSCKYKN